jgi:hypothetical protein
MSFFNKKEEILEIKLTSYGKQKLSKGTFKPTYYAFFDDGVLYDGARAGIVEDNNDIEPRIQDNSPSLRAQTSFTDLEKLVMKQTHDIIDGVYHEGNVTDIKHDPSVFQDYDGLRNTLPLGTAQLGNQYAAAWRVQFLEGQFRASRNSTNDDLSKKAVIPIPQITCDIEVQPLLVNKDFKGASDPQTGRYIPVSSVSTELESQQFIRVTNDYILLDVGEHNVDLLNDSFSLEVYEIETEDDKEILKPKVFKREVQDIVNDLMLDQDEIDKQVFEGETDSNFIEYFFNILTDDNIDNKTKTDKIVSREVRGSIFDTNVSADSLSQTPGSELYTTDNDGENC